MKKLDPQYDEIPEMTCPCGYTGEAKPGDDGIGPYEFWGAPGFHSVPTWECAECGATLGDRRML